jgi:hypothetical protein
MGKNILPVTYPPITTYTGYADTLAILCTHQEALDWVYSHYIQIQANDITNRVNNLDDLMKYATFTASFFSDFDTRKKINAICDSIFLRFESCPFLYVFELPNSYVNLIDSKLYDFIRRTIDNGMYIYGYFDHSKVSSCKTNFEMGHQFLIYGYDDDERAIHFADFINDGKYTFMKCSYEEIEIAFRNMDNIYIPKRKSVSLVQYLNDGTFIFDYLYIQKTISDYINPDPLDEELQNNYTMSLFKEENWKTKTYMGVNVYDYFPVFIEREIELGKRFIDHRLFHAMYDHKEMMLKRIQHFIQKEYLGEEKLLQAEKYSKVRDNMLIVRDRILKYNITKQPRELAKVKLLIAETKPLEKELLKEIFGV